MPDLPQPGWPLRFTTLPDGTVQYADVEQGSPADLKAAVAVVVCTPRGHRDDDPSFGITPLEFQTGLIDTHVLRDEIVQSDPRLDGLDADEIGDIAANVQRTVRVNTIGAA